MKTLKTILTLTIILLLTQACHKGSIWGIHGKGAGMSQNRSADNFSSISLDCEGDLYFVQDSVFSVKIEAQENILAVIETKVVDSQLRIGFLRDVRRHNGIKITVHSPYMNGVLINGNGNVIMQNTINTNLISLYINGSGNITVPTLNSSNVDLKISGSGNITISSGSGKTAVYSVSGSGNAYSSGMICNEGTVKISGSGNVSVNATEKLHVTISGSGDVRYKSKPLIDSKISGSGRLIALD